jgi:hypothetical protein
MYLFNINREGIGNFMLLSGSLYLFLLETWSSLWAAPGLGQRIMALPEELLEEFEVN